MESQLRKLGFKLWKFDKRLGRGFKRFLLERLSEFVNENKNKEIVGNMGFSLSSEKLLFRKSSDISLLNEYRFFEYLLDHSSVYVPKPFFAGVLQDNLYITITETPYNLSLSSFLSYARKSLTLRNLAHGLAVCIHHMHLNDIIIPNLSSKTITIMLTERNGTPTPRILLSDLSVAYFSSSFRRKRANVLLLLDDIFLSVSRDRAVASLFFTEFEEVYKRLSGKSLELAHFYENRRDYVAINKARKYLLDPCIW